MEWLHTFEEKEKHMSTGEKVALGAGVAVVGVGVLGLIGGVGAGGYMLHEHAEAKKQQASSLKLNVRVVRAQGLKSVEMGHSSSPYVVVAVGDIKMSSGVIEKNLNPEWNDQFQIGIFNHQLTQNALIHVIDKDLAHRSLGDASVALSEVPQEQPRSFELSLSKGGILWIEMWLSGHS